MNLTGILHQVKLSRFRGNRTVPASAVCNQDKGGISNCCGGTENEGAGGPVALQTSPPARRRESVDTYPHAALAGLTCRASPANSSIAGAAPLDSVRLRRNRSLLLCGAQNSPLTCARGADRAWARARSKPWRYASRRSPRLGPREGRGAVGIPLTAQTMFKAQARPKPPVRHFSDVIIQWTILNLENIYRLKQSFSSQNFGHKIISS